MSSAIHANQERYFNCAFIASVSDALIAESFESRRWHDIVNEARERIAAMLAPPISDRDATSADRYISLFANTTSALTRVLVGCLPTFDRKPV